MSTSQVSSSVPRQKTSWRDALLICRALDNSTSNLLHIGKIANTTAQTLELRERVTTNKGLCRRIIDDVATHSVALFTAIEQVKETGEVSLEAMEQDLQRYEDLLEDIYRNVCKSCPTGIGKLQVVKTADIKRKLERFSGRLNEFEALFETFRLTTLLSCHTSPSPSPRVESADFPQQASTLLSAASAMKHAAAANLPTALKILKDVAECLGHVPYVTTIAGVCVQILEIREQVKENKDLTDNLIHHVSERSIALLRSLEQVKGENVDELHTNLRRYERLLIGIHDSLKKFIPTPLNTLRTIANRDDVKKELDDHAKRLKEFDDIFTSSSLTRIEMMVSRLAQKPISTDIRIQKAASIPPPSAIFTGREYVLVKMEQHFRLSNRSGEQRVYVLYGMGGSGKTQIALKFVEMHVTWFSRTFFIDASNVESIATAFENMGSDAGIPEPTTAKTLRWLACLNEEWLLLFDNADDPSIKLFSYFPRCSHGNILITSRNWQTRQLAPSSHYHIGNLDHEEAVELLHKSSLCATLEDKEEGALLVQDLGHLALAIIQAGAYIANSNGLSFRRYREMFCDHRTELLRQERLQPSDSYEWTVYTTWEISFRRLSSLAQKVLRLFSFWYFDQIPKAIFRSATLAQARYPECEDAITLLASFSSSANGWNDFAFQQVVNELLSFSLLSSDFGDVYSMHPLVHAWARDYSSGSDQHCSRQLLALSIHGVDRHKPGVPFWKVVFPHVQASLAGESSLRTSADVNIASAFAGIYYDKGRYQEAESLEITILETSKKLLGNDHPRTLDYMHNLAMTYNFQGRRREAEELQSAVLTGYRKILGDDHPFTVNCMHNLAITYQNLGNWNKAEELQVAIFTGRKKLRGDDHLDTLDIMHCLAWTYHSQGRWSEAEALQSAALTGRKKILGDDHPETLDSMHDLALIYQTLGSWENAEELQTAVFVARQKLLGDDHPSTLTAMHSLAWTHWRRGRCKDALDLGKATLLGLAERVGGDHPSTINSLSDVVEYQRPTSTPLKRRNSISSVPPLSTPIAPLPYNGQGRRRANTFPTRPSKCHGLASNSPKRRLYVKPLRGLQKRFV